MTDPATFVLIDWPARKVATVDPATLTAALRAALQERPRLGLCGHAGFRVPDMRYLVPVLGHAADRLGGRLRLESALADARHSSDDRGSSPLRVHVEAPQGAGGIVTLKERLRLARGADRYVSAIPFGRPKGHDAAGVSHRTVLEAYRRVVSGDVYRWVSTRVMAAAERTLAGAAASLLDFHRHLRDVVLEEQFVGVDQVSLVATVATAFPAGHQEHIVATHQRQAAVAIDVVRSAEHAREVVKFFETAHASGLASELPRWLFAPVRPAAYFCRGFVPERTRSSSAVDAALGR